MDLARASCVGLSHRRADGAGRRDDRRAPLGRPVGQDRSGASSRARQIVPRRPWTLKASLSGSQRELVKSFVPVSRLGMEDLMLRCSVSMNAALLESN